MEILIGALIRLFVSVLSFLLVGAFLPGFNLGRLVNALAVALVIAILGYLIELVPTIKHRRINSKIRGLVGFIISVIVIYIAQFIIPELTISIIGALLAAVIIGIIDMIVPTFKIKEILSEYWKWKIIIYI